MTTAPTQLADRRLQELLDERDIRTVLHRYAAALDQKDWNLLASCFIPDASAHYGMIGELTGYAAIEQVCRTALQPMSRTQHLIGNVEVVLDGDAATSSCYMHAQHVRPGAPGGETNIIAGRYQDELVRTAQGWRIRRRTLDVWWTFGNLAIHELSSAG
jgi:3-phenylpropionate/cinnamic acid dioxygenase small subunit